MIEFLNDKSWLTYLKDEFQKDYMRELSEFLNSEDGEIFPKREEFFSALNLTPLEKVKVVILGQDPYHGEGQAHGLSFSVNKGVKIPPSLRNIYKELNEDLGVEVPEHGFLEEWAKEGVLLLNNCLSVRKAQAGSHQKKGWEKFTAKIIEVINEQCENVVFILWGSPAQKKGKNIDESKHLVLKSVHPSPLSSYRGFFGSKPFSKANAYLIENDLKPVSWEITN
ncbi:MULTISPECIES: uracil-DNA glycosylase [Halobacteriovorax]|uniref:Uracil-DNA glycosylase n=1 Tax=Halobacteriovorax vibrionivorans TaxID=2152716 RepID=A0ABY0IK38_9BACT|nr:MULTISPECIES: uracil-DNA glycosylase [Halobacteriovorax]AYF45809.1 uracil-DNA glycosylase [Halobacteriovorax sp. BALOs_7]RZF22849.1 uracil-DNA glycosylase [Halobacteriovorax vibrionivorans]TGD47358.1 uracil-DNA glycosylase [Halobacteriovorax sp. Y22]